MKSLFKCLFLSGCLSILLSACEQIAVQTTPAKRPLISNSPLAAKAEKNFWYALHHDHYHRIASVDRLLTAAYLENPFDPTLAAHLGFLHIWKLTERQQLYIQSPMIVNEAVLAKKYFSDAIELDPSDARYLGFYGDTQIAVGKIFQDQRLQTKGYFTLKRAIAAWPEFNYFTAGYIMSTLPADSKYFKEALEWQWKTLDLCANQKVNRINPSFAPYLSQQTSMGPKRACWNSWIAPFNYEGFFLNMGDMLVKSGDVKTAIKIYQNAELDKNYAAWPFKKMLEKRIKNANQNVKNFQQNKNILFNSGYGCAVCHRAN